MCVLSCAGFFHSAKCFCDASVLFVIERQIMCFYYWVVSHCKNTVRFVYPPPVHGLLGCFSIGLLRIHLLLTFKNTSFCGHTFSSMRGKRLGLELLGLQKVCAPFYKCLPDAFPKWLHNFTLPPTMFVSCTSSSAFCVVFLNVSHFNSISKPHHHLLFCLHPSLKAC